MTAVTTPPQLNDFLDFYAAQPAMLATHASVDLTDTVGRMRVEDTPFTYGIIDDFLPKAVYEAILRDWPAPSAFRPAKKRDDTQFQGARRLSQDQAGTAELGSRQVRLIENTSDPDQDPATGVWKQVAEALRAPSFIRDLFDRFSTVIATHLTTIGDATGKAPAFILSQSVDQGAREALEAHLDGPWKLLTVVIYLDLRGAVNQHSEQLWGTALYNTDPGSAPPTYFIPNADLELAGRVGFVPNRAFVMPNSTRALHGVAGGQPDVQRRTLMSGVWLW